MWVIVAYFACLVLGVAYNLMDRYMVNRNPEGHSPNYWKRHPELLALRQAAKNATASMADTPAVNSPKKDFDLISFVGFIGLPIGVALSFGFASLDMYPFVVNILVYVVCLIFVVVGVNRWERAARLRPGPRVFMLAAVVLVYCAIFSVPSYKQYGKEYSMDLTFRDDDRFTWWMRLQIRHRYARVREYFNNLKVPQAEMLPPIDITPGDGSYGQNPPNQPTYFGTIGIGELRLHSPSSQTEALFGYSVFRALAPDATKVPQDQAMQLFLSYLTFVEYFNSSFWDKPDEHLAREYPNGSLESRLWAVRNTYGKEFTDRLVAYTLLSLANNPRIGLTPDFEPYFCTHLKIADGVIDHNFRKWPRIVEILAEDGSGMGRYCAATAAK
jgi:hypothetical protein